MTDEPQKVNVRYYVAKLSNGAEVSVGFVPDRDADDSYYFHFKNSDSNETKLRLSKEAFEVIIALKEKADLGRSVKTIMRTSFVAHVEMDLDSSSIPAEPYADSTA